MISADLSSFSLAGQRWKDNTTVQTEGETHFPLIGAP